MKEQPRVSICRESFEDVAQSRTISKTKVGGYVCTFSSLSLPKASRHVHLIAHRSAKSVQHHQCFSDHCRIKADCMHLHDHSVAHKIIH